MAALDDIVTILKNAVVSISNNTQIMRRTYGTNTSASTNATTLIVNGPGRLVAVSVLVGGSADGVVYNSSSTGGTSSSNEICSLPTTVGFYPIGAEFVAGLVIAPGSGQTISVTYTPGAQ